MRTVYGALGYPTVNQDSSEQIDPLLVRADDDFPPGIDRQVLAEFLARTMSPYEDPLNHILQGIEYALSEQPGQGGFIVLALQGRELIGALVMLHTGMGKYVPENLLLFVSMEPKLRGQGIGGMLIRRAMEQCQGAVKLHVDPQNPAVRIYEKLGFEFKYHEMRYEP